MNRHGNHTTPLYILVFITSGLFLSKIVVGLVKFEMSWIPSKAMDIIDMTVSIRVVLGMGTSLVHRTTRYITGLKSRTFLDEPLVY
jgi:hypothetical protein